jgi:S-DNA-T family DNA segregation ATPase FtsK/SpoIIIE
MKHHKSKLAVSMGLDVSGTAVVADISKMPHVLIAGSTGSGKSVCINAFLGTLLFRCSPQELNLILVDPKRVELTGFNGIPHLLAPVIVDTDKVLSALKWAMAEMDRRYKQFAEVGVRNIEAFNELSGFQALPYIVIFIDELADIMLFAPVEVEDAITRIAQMARATGIHLVVSTQRPSVDVITGLIKANIPSRIAFAVSSMIDSKVIIDGPGAEKLLGRGDMLYVPPDSAKPLRIQGAFVSDKEMRSLIDFLKKQGVAPQYTEEVTSMPLTSRRGGKGASFISENGEERDPLFADALRIIVQHQNASASFLQRKLSIGYARAARILDELQSAGVVGPADGAKPRDILISDAQAFLSETPPSQSPPGLQNV